MRYGLYEREFEQMLKNPANVLWHLKKPAPQKFFTDLHNALLKKRVLVEEIGMIYRQIDKRINEAKSGNKSAYSFVNKISQGHNCDDEDLDIFASTNSEDSEDNEIGGDCTSGSTKRYIKHNVKRREKRPTYI